MLISALTAVVAAVIYAPVVGAGEFYADDLLFRQLLVPGQNDGVRVDWARVGEEFYRPWLGEARYWRPLVSLALALCYAISDGGSAAFYAVSVGVHAIITGLVGLFCARLCPWRPAWAALIGGLLFALHPAAVEPVAWLSARVSSLEVMFRMAALLCFAARLRTGQKAWSVATAGCAAAALASKESAFCIPVLMLLVDVLDAPRRPWRARLRLHLPFVPLWVGYAAWRVWLLGSFVGPAFGLQADDPSAWGAAAMDKAAFLVAPIASAGQSAVLVLGPALGLGVLFVLAVVSAPRRARLVLGVAVLGIGAHFAPSFAASIDAGWVGARMVYGAVPWLALSACALGLAPRARWWRAVGIALPLALPLVWAPARSLILSRYEVAWGAQQKARDRLAAWQEGSQRPSAILSMPEGFGVPGPAHPTAWSTVFEAPGRPPAQPVLGLGFVVAPLSVSMALHQDAAPMRALRREGVDLLSWVGAWQPMPVPESAPAALDAVPEALTRTGPEGGRWLLRTARSPWHLEALQLEIEGLDGPAGGRLRWLFEAGESPWVGFAAGASVGGTTRYEIDASHSLELMSGALAGSDVVGLEVELDAGGAVRAAAVRGRLPVLALPQRLAGRTVAIEALGTQLRAPTWNGRGDLRLVLLAPATGIVQRVTPGEPVHLGAEQAHLLRYAVRLASECRCAFYFEAVPNGAAVLAARSDVDWVVLR